GQGTKIWHYSHVQSGASIGEQVSIGQNVNVANNVVIGKHVKIQNNVSIYEGVELEDYVFCGPSMVFTNITHPRSEFPQRGAEFYTKTLVKKSASIGANATIVCGTTIGEYAFIGAGAVVTKDVPAFALVVGNPGRIIGWVDKLGHKLEFDENNLSVDGKYRLVDGDSIQYLGD
ncbi:N-acetyltransferase, partial [bacterium]|nr:N-acetyltransferase [bacterium]